LVFKKKKKKKTLNNQKKKRKSKKKNKTQKKKEKKGEKNKKKRWRRGGGRMCSDRRAPSPACVCLLSFFLLPSSHSVFLSSLCGSDRPDSSRVQFAAITSRLSWSISGASGR
jgi:hypothetical protein